MGAGKLRIRADAPTVTIPLSELQLCLFTRKDSVRVRLESSTSMSQDLVLDVHLHVLSCNNCMTLDHLDTTADPFLNRGPRENIDCCITVPGRGREG